jgi:hypothetical protein
MLSERIYKTEAILEIRNADSQRGGLALVREAIFIHMLMLSECGTTFKNAKTLSVMTDSPITQCEIVFTTAKRMGILTADNGSFSARKWLSENGFLPSETRTTIPEPKQPQNDAKTVQACNCTQERQTVANGPQTAANTNVQKPRSLPPRDGKVHVRQNVRLSDDEIDSLKTKYSDKEITGMVDMLSEWKTNKGVRNCNDFVQINKWVAEKYREANSVNTLERTDEQAFKDSHCGKTAEELKEIDEWANSEDGKKKIESYKARINALGFAV